MRFEYDVIVVGGGHAGCEAAVAAAKLGSRVLLVTMDMAKFANMSCNPAIGGVAKGQIVREIDALGGMMGIITDLTSIQFRMLNRSKGAAMWSPRAQCDKAAFSAEWRKILENTERLYIWQDAVTELITAPAGGDGRRADDLYIADGSGVSDDSRIADSSRLAISSRFANGSGLADSSRLADAVFSADGGHSGDGEPLVNDGRPADGGDGQLPETTGAEHTYRVCGVRTRMGVEFQAKAVILTNGTFLNGLMHVGRSSAEGGRAGDEVSRGLTENIENLGFVSGRMKTGTPARIDARTLNFELFEPQDGDVEPSKFSFLPGVQPVGKQLPCFLVHTNEQVHEELRRGFVDSPLFNGTIRGVGPRYCPSIEDKLRTFADKTSHQLFLEPEGSDTNEYYLNGFSSSLPLDVQVRALQCISGFEDVHIYRPGYAIEYDYFPPTQLKHTLETKLVENLYFAGQINGTTGYEEAAAQGLMAGVNAHMKLSGRPPLVLLRDEAYIGVLIDDLVTKGVDEPYRMFTSRAEYRILLRQDNADLRLTPIAIKIGLADAERTRTFEQKKLLSESFVKFIRERSVAPDEIQDYLKSVDSAPLSQGRKLYDILLRNEVTLSGLIAALPDLREFTETNAIGREIVEEAEIQVKYHGYIEREKFIAAKLKRLENIAIPDDFDFYSLRSLTIEARQKLSRIRPATIGQASRIPGVSPADINVLLVYFGR